jgi:hypothetical protein
MVLFLIFSIPVAVVLYFKLVFSGYFEGGQIWPPFYRGLASFVISALPIYLIIELYPVTYTQSALYLRFLMIDFLVFCVGALLFFFMWERRKLHVSYGKPLFVEIAAFFGGYVVLIGVLYAVVHSYDMDTYRLFAYPVLLLLLFWLTSVLVYLYQIAGDWKGYLWIAALLGPALLYSLIPFFHMTSHIFYCWLSFVLLAVLTAAAALLFTKKRILPGL